MKSYVAAALFAGAAMAQSISDLPSCSLSCIVSGVTGLGCSVTDYSCACGKADQLTATLTPCVQSACSSTSDQAKVITVLEGICAAAGVPITISTPAASSAAAATSAPASSSAEAASSVVATSAAASSAAASSAAASSAAASSAGSVAASSSCVSTTYTTVTVVSPSTYPSASSGGSNGTAVTSATLSPTQYTGAASANGVTFGAAGALGLLAYLL